MTTTEKTAKPALKAKAQYMQFKVKDVLLRRTAEGKDSYSAELCLPYGDGFSKWPVKPALYIHGSELVSAKEIFDWLSTQKGQVVTLHVTPSKLKTPYTDDDGVSHTFTDDEQFKSYFWNITGLQVETGQAKPTLVAPSAAKAPPVQSEAAFQASLDQTRSEAAYERARAYEPPLFEDEPPKQGQPKTVWDATRALIGASWAITQATTVIMAYHGGEKASGWSPEFWDTIKKQIAELAPKFLAMRDWLAQQEKPRRE